MAQWPGLPGHQAIHIIVLPRCQLLGIRHQLQVNDSPRPNIDILRALIVRHSDTLTNPGCRIHPLIQNNIWKS